MTNQTHRQAEPLNLMVFHGTPGQEITLDDVNDSLINGDIASYFEVTGDAPMRENGPTPCPPRLEEGPHV